MINQTCQRASTKRASGPALLLALAVLAPALLSACSKPDNASGPGGVTVGEARALDDAAEMIEKQQLPPTAIPSAPVAAPVPGAQP